MAIAICDAPMPTTHGGILFAPVSLHPLLLPRCVRSCRAVRAAASITASDTKSPCQPMKRSREHTDSRSSRVAPVLVHACWSMTGPGCAAVRHEPEIALGRFVFGRPACGCRPIFLAPPLPDQMVGFGEFYARRIASLHLHLIHALSQQPQP